MNALPLWCTLEEELETELARRRIELRFVVRDGAIRFEQAIIARHKGRQDTPGTLRA
jgi:hypothetical protein